MPTNTRQFSMELESHLKLKLEVKAPQLQPTPVPPTINSVLTEIGPLPPEALFLGVASDGLPVLLNLHDPLPGPLLVTGGEGAGKSNFLLSVARAVAQTHDPEDLQYGVITNSVDRWRDIEQTPHQAGIFSVEDSKAQEHLFSLTSWAHTNKFKRRSTLLLIDDLEALAVHDFESLQNFRWLLARGPSRRVWPVITMNADRYGQVLSWIPLFRTRVFGRIQNERFAEALAGDTASALGELEAPIQFSLRENEKWVRFWLPSF